jgi:hypothetical protein
MGKVLARLLQRRVLAFWFRSASASSFRRYKVAADPIFSDLNNITASSVQRYKIYHYWLLGSHLTQKRGCSNKGHAVITMGLRVLVGAGYARDGAGNGAWQPCRSAQLGPRQLSTWQGGWQ